MAKYEGTYACGHDGVVNVIGKMRDRQRKIDYAFSHLCPQCAKKEREKQIAEENKNSEVLSKEYGFPELAGSEKQVAWANTIRLDFYNEYEDYLATQEMIENETTASFWLDLDRFVSKKDFLRKYERTKKEKERRDRIIDIDAVAPEDLQYKGVVEIVKKLDKICLFYLKNQDFIDLAKTKGYRWNEDDYCWYRRLNEETGKYADRAAEIGHELLKNGFAICIHDSEITEKAINGDYEEERTKWIKCDLENKVLTLHWSIRSDEIYNASRKIVNNRYNHEKGYVEIPIANYRSVNNFAKKFDFCYTESALETIEQYKKEQREMRRVKADK